MTKGRQGSYKYLEQIKMKQVEEAGGDVVIWWWSSIWSATMTRRGRNRSNLTVVNGWNFDDNGF